MMDTPYNPYDVAFNEDAKQNFRDITPADVARDDAKTIALIRQTQKDLGFDIGD